MSGQVTLLAHQALACYQTDRWQRVLAVLRDSVRGRKLVYTMLNLSTDPGLQGAVFSALEPHVRLQYIQQNDRKAFSTLEPLVACLSQQPASEVEQTIHSLVHQWGSEHFVSAAYFQ